MNLSPLAPSPVVGDVGRMATALLARAARALPLMPQDSLGLRAAAVAALDGFIARPAPATFLRAQRVLADCARTAVVARLDWARQTQSFADGLAALRQTGAVPDTVLTSLDQTLPVRAGTGEALQILATFMETLRELDGRVEADVADLRRRFRAEVRPRRRRATQSEPVS